MRPCALILVLLGSVMTLTQTAEANEVSLQELSLRDLSKDSFLFGAAINRKLFHTNDVDKLSLIAHHCSAVTTCNMLKWKKYNPEPGVLKTDDPDRFLSYAEKHDMFAVGHVFFWHNSTPAWVFENDKGGVVDRATLLKRMRERVRELAQRYGERIHAWDVVNEAVMGNGSLRKSKWSEILGPNWVVDAFRIADEELPKDVELYYNDYNMQLAGKRDAVVKIVKDIQAQGIRIDGVGMQGHWLPSRPSAHQIEKSIVAFHDAGVDVHITELDIDMLPRKKGMMGADVQLKQKLAAENNPYINGLPDDKQQLLAKRYAELFGLFLKHQDKIKRVTFWGFTDGNTWLNGWPVKGRTNHPMLFDRNCQPKPAFHAVVDVLRHKE